MITDGAIRLEFGALDLMGRDKTGPYWFEALAETEFGEPVPVVKLIESFLMDGAIETTESFGNREMTLPIAVRGEDSAGLALGEEALMGQLHRRNTLTYAPPNKIVGSGTPSVFDVVTSSMAPAFNDMLELNLERVYKVTIKALPFARSNNLTRTVSPAPPGTSPTVTSVDSCSTTTGWTVNGGGATLSNITGTAVVAKINNATTSVAKGRFLRLTRAGLSVSMTGSPYVRIDSDVTGQGRNNLVTLVKINGIVTTASAQNGTVGWYLCPGATLTGLEINCTSDLNPGGLMQISIDDVSRSTAANDAIGQRQRFQSIDVGGSARSQGSIAVEDPANALGSVLLYTSGSDAVAQPPLRARLSVGPVETADTSLVSGKSSDLGTNHVFLLPSGGVPSGGYGYYARVKATTSGAVSLTWAAKSAVGANIVDASQSGTTSVTLTANTWTIVYVANLTLPTSPMGPSGAVRLELSGPVGLLLDEAWLFNVGAGRLTWVECGTGTATPGGPASRMWANAASLDSPVPSIWVGNAADQSDSYGAGSRVVSFAEHDLPPPAVNCFVVTTDSVAAQVTFSYFPHAHTHVA